MRYTGFAFHRRGGIVLGPPLDLYPDNPRFFRFRGEPTFLLTSAEHYGAVFNLDLDAPRPGRFLAPWARSGVPGYAYGGSRFDLDRIEPAYVERLRDFVRQAGLRGVIVELTLFTAMYTDTHWTTSPMHPDNNVNGVGRVAHDGVYRLDNDGLLPYQVALAQRLAAALVEFDNVFLELVNEPYFANVAPEWTDRIVAGLEEEFDRAGRRLLLAWNVANFHGRADAVAPGVSVLNFHYANPPDAVRINHDLAVPVVYDETGYLGIADGTARERVVVHGISKPGEAYACHLAGELPERVELHLAPGEYRYRWIDPVTGTTTPAQPAPGEPVTLPVPAGHAALALLVTRHRGDRDRGTTVPAATFDFAAAARDPDAAP
jgi:hypothetical protein